MNTDLAASFIREDGLHGVQFVAVHGEGGVGGGEGVGFGFGAVWRMAMPKNPAGSKTGPKTTTFSGLHVLAPVDGVAAHELALFGGNVEVEGGAGGIGLTKKWGMGFPLLRDLIG